jgi:hypothetical protein
MWLHAGHYVLGSVVVADGTMEAATTTAWNGTTGTLAKDAAVMHTGTRSLRLTKTGTGVATIENTTPMLTVGATYVLSCWVRISASTIAPSLNDGSVVLWTGVSTANLWQHISVEFTATTTNLQWVATGGGVGTRIWVDDISITSNRVATLLDQSANGRDMVQSTDALRPTHSVVGGLSRINFTQNPASLLSYAGSMGATGTIFYAGTCDGDNDGNSHVHFGDLNVGWLIYSTWVGGQPRWTIYNGSSFNQYFAKETPTVFEFRFDGANSYYATNGGTKTTGNAGVNTPASFNIGHNTDGYGFDGYLNEMIIIPGTVTDEVRHSVVAHLRSAWSI